MKKINLIVTISFLILGQNLFAQGNDSIILSNAVLHYSFQGKGQPILFLSGGPGDASGDLADVSEHLIKNYKCILFDQRGTGKSHTSPMDSSTINLHQAMEDINILLQRLKINKIIILGHSWGTMLALSYAIRYPDHVAKMILIGPGPLKLSDYNILVDNIHAKASKAERIFMKQAEESIAHQTASKELINEYSNTFMRLLYYDPAKFDSLQKQNKLPAHSDKMGALMMEDLQRINYNVQPEIPELRMPILVICGRQDPVGVFPAFTIKELNKNSKLAWIDQCGHFPWIDNPNPFYTQLHDFLK